MLAVHGECRAPTGVAQSPSIPAEGLELVRAAVDAASARLGQRLTLALGKFGLDGHYNGAEQIATRARDCGMAVRYHGIRQTPDEIVPAAVAEGVDVLGLSILSGSHLELVAKVMAHLRERGDTLPVVVGGIIPQADADSLKVIGVAAVFGPTKFDFNRIMLDIVALADRERLATEQLLPHGHPCCGFCRYWAIIRRNVGLFPGGYTICQYPQWKIHVSVELHVTIPGEIVMQNDWILDVLSDLRSFAQENGLPRLAQQLDETTLLAAVEISNSRSSSGRAFAVDPMPQSARDLLNKGL